MTIARPHVRLASLLLAAASVGCAPERTYELSPVSGRVTLDGEPLAGGVVVVQPRAAEGGSPGPGSTGRCDADGRYRLTTVDGDAGAVVGTHTVRIYSQSSDQPAAGDVDMAPQTERVPERYNYRTTLTLEVPAGGTEAADFPLVTQP